MKKNPSLYKYAVIVGTRPNFIKAAPFFARAKEYPEFQLSLIHTGQHFDDNMSKVFFEEMGIPKPDINLNVRGVYHTERIGKMFSGLKKILSAGGFHGVIVFGDVNSTLAGAIASARSDLRLIHIESGLRSHDKRMPEEINRVIVDHLSDLLFTSESSARENLILEGIDENKIKFVGNIMIESLEIFQDKIKGSGVLDKFDLSPQKYVVATIHRQENIDNPAILKEIFGALDGLAKVYPIIFPMHPGTKIAVAELGLGKLLEGISVIEPLGYFDFIKLVSESIGVVTDSGGIQEEASHLAVPCCTLRDNTERPVTLTLGSNKLYDVKHLNVSEIIRHLNRSDFRKASIPLWDNEVSKRIFEFL